MNNENKVCFGTEFLDEFVTYNTNKYPNISFTKSTNLLDFGNLKKFDLITCTHKTLNNLDSINKCSEFFKLVYKHLNNGGVFIFNFYTKNQLENWNEVIYTETEKYNHIREIKTNESKSNMLDIYYLKLDSTPQNGSKTKEIFKRTERQESNYSFDSDMILKEIINAKFRYLITTDENLRPIPNLKDSKIGYIIAIKRETLN